MKKIIALLFTMVALSSCGYMVTTENEDSFSKESTSSESQNDDIGVSESSEHFFFSAMSSSESQDNNVGVPAYIVIPDGNEFVEMKNSTENGSTLCRLYVNDEITFNYSEKQFANISANGFTGYIELSNISFSAVETSAITQIEAQPETQPQIQFEQQAPPTTEVQAAPVQALDNNDSAVPEINIENTITIQFDFDDFEVKYARPLSYPEYVENKSKTEGYCIVESCYIFSEPSSDSYKDVKYMVYKDSGVEILGSVDDWYFIRRDFGSQCYRIGYVPKNYIALGASPEAIPVLCSKITVSKGSACINKYPKICEGSDVLGYAGKGEVYTVYDLIDNYWYKIGYGSGYAYISHKMVEPY